MSKLISVLVLILPSFALSGQTSVPDAIPGTAWVYPVKHNVKLTGNFCELRSNHFHAGIDIKSSKGVAGDSIFAIADGYIRRLRVQRGGYGQTVYIDHPQTKLTSVYAHLEAFAPEYKTFIREKQYAQEHFEVDLYPEAESFPVKKGQFIGLMGNRGHSYGAHLHFELRTIDTEIPVNPFAYGFAVADNRPPEVTSLKLYALDKEGVPLHSDNIKVNKVKAGIFKTSEDTLSLGAWRMGVGLGCFDRQDGAWNKNGVYRLSMTVDGALIYSWRADRCSFDETHHINAHIDYEERVMNNRFVHRCHVLPGNPLSMYDSVSQAGHVALFADKARKVEIKAQDWAGNISELGFYVKRDEVAEQEGKIYHTWFEEGKSNIFTIHDMVISSSESSLYHRLGLKVEVSLDEKDHLSEILIGDPAIPLKEPLSLLVPAERLPMDKAKNLHLEYFDPRRKTWSSVGGSISESGGNFSLPRLGLYRTMIDTVAPSLTWVSVPKNLSPGSKIKLKLKDDTATRGKALDLEFHSSLNGRYILSEFDEKNSLLIIPIESSTPTGPDTLRIKAWDNWSNETEVTRIIP
jgi:hypothetical protein